jgi:protein gp37
MGATKITWTNRVWNPCRGCSPASPGCEHCYAEAMARRFPWGAKVTSKKGRWNGKVELLDAKLGDPLRWREPSLVFVNSVSDLFHPAVPFDFVAAVFGVMAAARKHTFQVLTKRPERMAQFFAWLQCEWLEARSSSGYNPRSTQADLCTAAAISHGVKPGGPLITASVTAMWPLPNVWLGATAEDQLRLDDRWGYLNHCPAAVRFLSLEPMLGPIDLDRKLGRWSECPACGEGVKLDEDGCCATCGEDAYRWGVDWVIVGGESGPRARPCDARWIRNVVAKCRKAEVPCFVKQLGRYALGGPRDIEEVNAIREKREIRRGCPDGTWRLALDGEARLPALWPHDLRVQEYPAADKEG